ncbi:hypothetical protein CCUG62472_03685 [Mycobacteroides salmoniphilum]|nr:hypothetical protein CCUG62472_03685 [Mycobacteroides salmoniphilum]
MARVASLLGPDAMRIVARGLKLVNAVPGLFAPRLKHMAVIEHVGRKSGKRYRTPVMCCVEDGYLSVVLNYGAKADWVRNVQAAGSAGVQHRGRRHRLANPRVLPIDSLDIPAPVRAVQASTESALRGRLSEL